MTKKNTQKTVNNNHNNDNNNDNNNNNNNNNYNNDNNNKRVLRVVRGQLSYSSPLDYGFLLIYLIEKFSFNCSRGGEKKSVS